MSVKLTKTQLRLEQVRLSQLQKYLPTLQLKKSMLQIEVFAASLENEKLQAHYSAMENHVDSYKALLTDRSAYDLFTAVSVEQIKTRHENIAGVDIPVFEAVEFRAPEYFLFDSPLWLDSAIAGLKELITAREKLRIGKEKKRALEHELRAVSIRVNLFEKIMIPRASGNIKKIKIFLGDQQLAAVSQAKVSKRKILERELR